MNNPSTTSGQRLPSSTVTFLFTDIEGSTKLAQEHREQWENLRQRHHAILQSAMDAHNGYVFQIIGDAFCVAFHTASDGLHAAIDAQRKLHNEKWGNAPVKVRMGIHTGEAELQSTGDYHGYLAMSRVKRLMSAGHGGQVLISQATQELIRDDLPKDISLRDLGEKRLKDLIRPEHIYQLVILNLPVDFPPLKTLDIYRHNLPPQLTSFIGREKEMNEIRQTLAEHRLVTLIGSGGAGKTRLSLQVAADLLDSFPNGIWFVELASITDPELIPQTILSAADMQTQQGKSALDSLKDFLREKMSLLVLDNCEHLIEACAKLADTLLHTAPNLKILASSREALGVNGEQAWHVPSLSIPDVKHLPPIEGLSQYEAVRLFIDRALLVQPHFAVTNDNAPAVAQICSQLDGIPLAIELAAARLKVLKAEQIAERLNDRFRLLTGGSRTALPRQQTLRALIDWSYDLLSENEKSLIRRLSVFMGGWTLEAAEQVCSDDSIHVEDILDLLTHLVNKSLVIIDEQPIQLRYRMLETVRQYAREKLVESGEGEKLRTQHLAYFLKFAEDAAPHLFRTEQIEWFRRLEQDYDNLRIALEWGMESGEFESLEAGFRLIIALEDFWYMQGHWMEGREWMIRILKLEQQSRSLYWARALLCAAMFEEDPEKVDKLCDEGLAVFRELNHKPGIARALFLKGYLIRNNGDVQRSKPLLEESLSLYRELQDKRRIGSVIYNLGYIAFIEQGPSVARIYYEESLQMSREIGERRFTAVSLMSLGDLAMARGDFLAARNCYEESISLGRELGDKYGLRMYLWSLGILTTGQGNYQQAEKMFEESLTLAQELGDTYGIAYAIFGKARAARFRGDYDASKKLIEIMGSMFLNLNYQYGNALSSWCAGEMARLQSDYPVAVSSLIEALPLAKEMADQELVAYSFEEVAALGAMQGHAKRAAILFGVAEALREVIHIVLLPVEKIEVDKNIAAARAQLDEATFNAAWAEGRAMKIEDAIEYALKELEK